MTLHVRLQKSFDLDNHAIEFTHDIDKTLTHESNNRKGAHDDEYIHNNDTYNTTKMIAQIQECG